MRACSSARLRSVVPVECDEARIFEGRMDDRVETKRRAPAFLDASNHEIPTMHFVWLKSGGGRCKNAMHTLESCTHAHQIAKIPNGDFGCTVPAYSVAFRCMLNERANAPTARLKRGARPANSPATPTAKWSRLLVSRSYYAVRLNRVDAPSGRTPRQHHWCHCNQAEGFSKSFLIMFIAFSRRPR